MRPEPPQIAASDENNGAPDALPGVLTDSAESAEGTTQPAATTEAKEVAHQERTGLRVMRTSPAILIFCGLVFVSSILLLDFMTQTGATSARQSAPTTEAPKLAQTAPTPRQPPTPVAQTSVTAPTPEPSVEPQQQQIAQPAPISPADINTQVSVVPAPLASAPQSAEGFTLQISSYNELAQAQERVEKLGSFGVEAYVARVEIPKRGTWYRVQTGHFGSREEAVRYGTQLRSKGAVADFIVTASKGA